MNKPIFLKSTLCLFLGLVCNIAWAALGTTKTGTPENGKKYYIYADTYYGGQYVNRYLYNDNGMLKMNAGANESSNHYVWICAVNSGKYTFQNMGDPTKYLSHKAVANTAYNFTIGKAQATHEGTTIWSDAADRYLVAKNDGTKFDQANRTYNQATEDWCTDYVFVEYVEATGKQISVTSNIEGAGNLMVNGTATTLPYTKWENSITLPLSLSVVAKNPYKFLGFYNGNTYLGNTYTLNALDESMNIEARFEFDIFSKNYDEKWVNILRATNANHAAILDGAEEGTIPTFNNLDYANEGVLWCLVGTAEKFKIYNKVSGKSLALTPSDTPANGVPVKMVSADNAQNWHLISYSDGYAIAPIGNNSWGINSYTGQIGNQLKFYGVSDAGTHWNFSVIDLNKPLSVSAEVDKTWKSSPRVAELTFTVNGSSSATRILDNIKGQRMYLPENATFSVSSMTYRGYTFNGFGDGAYSYENQILPEGGMEIVASYTANDERTLFYSPRDGRPYRIPAIATAPNGDIFAICDYRPCGNDIGYGEVDLVCRVSSDNGITWTEERTIADGHGYGIADGDTSKIWQVGFGDPAIVADRESNKVLVMSVCGNRTCWDGNYGEANPNPNRVSRLYITYDEDKQEWVYGEPEEVTYSIYPLFDNKNGGEAHAASLFIGAGKICQSRVVKKGNYYRLYCAVWNVTKSIRQHHNYVIYSDDFGQTWNVLGNLGYDNCPSKYGNEPKCEELPDGTVVLSSRKYGGRYFNLFTFDDDTYTTGKWGAEVSSNDISGGLSFGGNSTNGEIYKVRVIRKADETECDLMFQSIPTGSDRSNVAIYYKEMEYNADGTNKYTPTTFSQGWTKGMHVSTKGSCYSTMISQADGRIAFFFEEEPSGYCMVYIPFTISELTDGKYYSLLGEDSNVETLETTTQGAEHIYDLMGRRVESMAKGLYIVNGSKVFIK